MENKEEVYKAMRDTISHRKELYETLLSRRVKCITQLAALQYMVRSSGYYERRKELTEEKAEVERDIINFGWEAIGVVSYMYELWNPIGNNGEK